MTGQKIFTDPRLYAAIVDRLTFGANIIETDSDSYRRHAEVLPVRRPIHRTGPSDDRPEPPNQAGARASPDHRPGRNLARNPSLEGSM
jgi:hypothetical protein